MNQNVGIALVLARNVPDITMDSAKHASMAITWMAKRVRNAMLIVQHAQEDCQLNVLDVIKATSWTSLQTALLEQSKIQEKDAEQLAT